MTKLVFVEKILIIIVISYFFGGVTVPHPVGGGKGLLT